VADYIEMGTPQTVEELAQRTGVQERTPYRLLRFTASYGVFRETTHREFDHTSLSAALHTDADGSFRPAAQMFHRIFAGWDGLHDAVQTGELSFQMVLWAASVWPRWRAPGACGAVLRRYPHLKGILFDLGPVAGRARAAMRALGLEERCSIREGSFFESVPYGADAYVLRHVIHDWTDEQIFRNCRKVIPPHGRILLVEFAVPSGNQASVGKDADRMMLAFRAAWNGPKKSMERCFAESGFRLSKVTPTKSAVSVIEASPV
jgi:hypothetical protein